MSTSTTPTAKPVENHPAEESFAAPGKSHPDASPSFLASGLIVKGDLETVGDIAVEGTIEGNCHAHLVTVCEGATVNGELVAEDVVVQGRVIGRLRGLRVRLTASAHVEGDIIYKVLALESGAYFEGSVERQDNPTGKTSEPARVSQPFTTKAVSASAGNPSKSDSAR